MPTNIQFRHFIVWVIAVVLGVVALCSTDFKSKSHDSKFYSTLVQRMSDVSPQQWLAMKWEENYWGYPEDAYIRDHLLGNIMLGALLSKIGVPSRHSLTIVQMLCQLFSLFLLVAFCRHFLRDRDPLILICLLQLMPISCTYGLRANHEQAMMFFMLLALYGAVKMATHWRWLGFVLLGCLGVFLIKGFMVAVVPIMSVAAYFIASDAGLKNKTTMSLLLLFSSLAVVIFVGILYEHYFREATGLEFFSEYWRVQIQGRSLNLQAEHPFLIQKLYNFLYYISRLFFYGLPWTVIALYILFRNYKKNFESKNWRIWKEKGLPAEIRAGLILLTATLIYIGAFSLSNRTASRYIFPTFYFASTAAILLILYQSPKFKAFQEKIQKWDFHYTAASIWLLSLLGHLLLYLGKQKIQ